MTAHNMTEGDAKLFMQADHGFYNNKEQTPRMVTINSVITQKHQRVLHIIL